MNDPLVAEELVSTAGEREVLETFVDSYRAVLVRKLAGLSEEDARRTLVPSATTLLGLLKHCAVVERVWFQHRVAGVPRDQIDGHANGDDSSFVIGPQETIATVVAEYERACAASREIAAGVPLDHTVPHQRMGQVSLRWIYVHMIEELARHAGHADILREQIDGSTGD
jgi:uncharacterized damage-inducible protein DinB